MNKVTVVPRFLSLQSELKVRSAGTGPNGTRSAASSWLIAHCVLYCSFKVDWNFNLIFNEKKNEEKLEVFQALNFYNAALNYAAISQLFISVAVLWPCFKKHAKWEWARHAVSTHFTQKCLQEKIPSQCRFHISLRVFQELYLFCDDPCGKLLCL